MNASDKTNCILHGAYLWSNYMNSRSTRERQVTLPKFEIWAERYPDFVEKAKSLNEETFEYALNLD